MTVLFVLMISRKSGEVIYVGRVLYGVTAKTDNVVVLFVMKWLTNGL